MEQGGIHMRKREGLFYNWQRIVAALLIIVVSMTSLSLENLAADNVLQEENSVEKYEKEYEISRDNVIESENTENSTTYDMGDGLRVTEFYAQDVRFQDEEGKLVDYDSSLVEVNEEISSLGNILDSYAYENKEGDMKHYFPEKLTEETPLLMEKGEQQIRFVPMEAILPDEQVTEQTISENLTEEASVQFQIPDTESVNLLMEKVENIYTEEELEPIKTSYSSVDQNVSFEYTSLENGIKEEIILTSKPEKNEFSFLLEIPGMTIRENIVGGGMTIYADGKIAAGIQEPYMDDATGEAYSEAVTYSLETLDEEAGRYCITLTVDKAYLEEEERIYPVTIDPTIIWNSDSQMSEVYALSNYPSYNYLEWDVTSFYLGKGQQGVSRAFLMFGDLSKISKRYIKKATLTLTEAGGSLAGKTIQAYRAAKWWELDTLTWNNQPGTTGGVVGSVTTQGGYGKTEMNLTSLFQNYADRTYTDYGLVLKNANESSSSYFTKFFGMRHATANYRPKLTIEYYDRPAKPVSVKSTPQYVKAGEATKIEWAGITSSELSYIQYRSSEYDEKTQKEIKTECGYSANTKIGTTANGSGNVIVGKSVQSGSYKTYKVSVRGVGKSSALGEENWTLVKVDNAPPKGNIKVLASGTAQETTILQDTVEIVGEVDGTGSPIKTSSMKLYDSTGKFVQDIYTNSTQSKIQNVFTPDIPNGTYTLKLTMEDSVGFTSETEKQIQIVNKLSAPIVRPNISNNGNVEIDWEFTYVAAEVGGISYKIPESEEWITVATEKTNGTITVQLPDKEGTYDVEVCGVDTLGNRGEISIAKCIIDKTRPVAILNNADRGLIYGTILDDNLAEWKIFLRDNGVDETRTLLQGKNAVEDGYIGLFDSDILISGQTYKLCLEVYDKAGNKSETDIFVQRQDQVNQPERVSADFIIKRPRYTAHSMKHIVFPANISKIELEKWPTGPEIPIGTTKWYCDGELVSSERAWSNNLPTAESGSHSILAIVDNGINSYYSQPRIKNKEIIPVRPSEEIQLPEGCISFKLNMKNQPGHVRVQIDGVGVYDTVSSTTYEIASLENSRRATASMVCIIPIGGNINTLGWTLEVDCIDGETFELSSAENYHPYEASVKDKLNYKTYLKWDGVQGTWPENVFYEVYRGQDEGFTPSADNLVASDLKANYWAEMNVNYSQTFYYRIRAVEKDSTGNIIKASSFSEEVASTVIDADEYVKRLGVKEYWEYAEFDTPSGNGAIEKSKGNLVYTQVDTEIPNEQLPVILERTYNSQSSEKTAFGVGWTHSFDMELVNICKNDSLDFKNIVLKDGDGTLYFYNQKDNETYISSMGKYTELRKETKTEEVELPDKTVGVKDKKKKVKIVSEFTMKTKDNIEYRFNSSGQLIYMAEANGNFLLFEYEKNKGLLAKVITSKNLTMEFDYYTEADFIKGKARPDILTVKEVRLPDGSKVNYEYSDGRLVKIVKTGTDKTSTREWTLEYNDAKQLTGLSDACANIYTIGYDGKKANKITYPNRESIVLEYDTKNNKTTAYKEVNENGATERILLETNTFEPSSGNSIQMVDNKGSSVTYEYTDNLVTKSIYSTVYQELEGKKVVEKTTKKTDTTKYSQRDNIVEEVDEDGVKSTYIYDQNAPEHLKDYPVGYQEVNAEGYFVLDEKYTYDTYGNVIRSYDAIDGRVVETTYYEEDDPATGKIKGEVKSEREYYINNSANETSTETTYSYDASGKKTEIQTEKSGQYTITTTTVYDIMGREISSTDTMGTSTVTEYDPFGRVKKITVKQGGITDVITYEYDNNGTMLKNVAEDGTVYTYSYDNMNRLVKEGIQKDGLSKNWTTEYSYGSVKINTGKGKKTVDHVLITTEKNPDGNVMEVTYVDTFGKVLREKKDGLYIDYDYDTDGNVVASCQLGSNPDNENPIITAYLYDKNGNAAGQILNPGYDAEANSFTVTSDSLTQHLTYDSTGNVLTTTDGEGNTTSYTYDANSRLTSVTEPAIAGETASVTRYKYDQFDTASKNGNTQNIVTDALGRTSVVTYNITMQPINVSDTGNGNITAISTSYTYDSKGRVAKETDSLGTSRTFDYDGKDRVTTAHYTNASGAEVLRTSYTYDKSDNVTTMLDYTVNGTTATLYRYTEFKYDRLKRLTSVTELNTNKAPTAITAAEKEAHTTKYTYDIDGNLLSVMYPQLDWKIAGLEYKYDTNKWLQGIEAIWKDGKKATIRTYKYDEYGAVSEIKDYRVISEAGEKVDNPEHTICSYTYDDCRRPATMSYADSTDPGTVKESYTYAYDKNSRLVEESIQNLYPEVTSDCQNEVRKYSYDAKGRLTKTEVEDLLDTTDSYVMTYTYDAVGNRLTQEKSSAGVAETTRYIYNSLNQLLSSETKKADGTVTASKTYQYDANGNQLKDSDSISKKETQNTYDAAGRLSACTIKENGNTTTQQINQYNGSGTRIQKAENGMVTNYYYSQGGVLYTEDGNGKGTSLNLHGTSGNIIATGRKAENKEGYYYYHKDPAGSITNLRDAGGKSIVSYQYTDFGQTNIYGDADFYNEICYNESIYDKSTGLYYLSARYYDPEDGRFISRDRYRGNLANPSTIHLYAYCANNPVNYEDPSGHIALSRIVGGIVGAAAGIFTGSKIAKKTKAKGWKKVAIIAGCAVGGAVVGALAGPSVAKVAKKAVKVVKKKLPSRSKTVKTSKVTKSKPKPAATKKITKTKSAISKSKSKPPSVKGKVNNVGVKSKPTQVHHYATNKNKTYTQKFKKITDKYELDLNGSWNKEVLPHQGRHPNKYHDFILRQMGKIDDIAKGNTDIFLDLFETQVKSKVRDNPEMLYSRYWKNLLK